MKILIITTSFNSMSQRAWVELDRLNHQVKVHIASSDEKMIGAVNNFEPDLIIAPFLKAKIPEVIWKNYTCFIVHPGIVGDRGSASLDWAILNNEKEWGVTILQAAKKMDAGLVWSTATFPMRNISKSFLYRHEVTQAAMKALLEAVSRFEQKNYVPMIPEGLDAYYKGKWNRATNENDFKFSFNEKTEAIIKKVNAADGFPGAVCNISENEYFAYGAVEEDLLKGTPGSILGKRNGAVCISTKDGAIWIQCLKKTVTEGIKLPAATVLGDQLENIEELNLDIFNDGNATRTFREIWYEEDNGVGYLNFQFYNGAMSTDQCNRLAKAFIDAKQRSTKVIVLMGGADIWSNGIHLNMLEASENPGQASWENINAIDDLIHAIIWTDTHYVISALQGNAGAGGVSLALAADKVLAKKGIVFNPHTRNMGLYGSEYWTYLLPKRIGDKRANLFTEQCLPWGTDIAMEVKLIDSCLSDNAEKFCEEVKNIAVEVAHLSYYDQLIAGKKFKRRRDENYKPLQKYREEELEKMYANFFEDDWGYDYKRYCFVHKINAEETGDAITSKDLFSERRKIWRRRKYEKLFYED